MTEHTSPLSDLRRAPAADDVTAIAQERESERAAQAAALHAELGATPEPEFVKLLHQMADVEHLQRALRETTTLGTLIDALDELEQELPVEFAGAGLAGTRPQQLTSWRGCYADLAIVPAAVDPDAEVPGSRDVMKAVQVVEVRDFVHGLLDAVGGRYDGYKGGTFTMTRQTPVWVSLWGQADRLGITGVSADTGLVLLHVVDHHAPLRGGQDR